MKTALPAVGQQNTYFVSIFDFELLSLHILLCAADYLSCLFYKRRKRWIEDHIALCGHVFRR
jgi:hypothetical protein